MFKNKKIIFSNFFSLSILEVSNYLFPLITLPYVVRTLGSDNYGFLAISTAITNYLLIIVGYGFNIWATKEIAQNKNLDHRNYIFSGVIYSKFLLAILIIFISNIMLLFFEIDIVLKTLLAISFFCWFYQMYFILYGFSKVFRKCIILLFFIFL